MTLEDLEYDRINNQLCSCGHRSINHQVGDEECEMECGCAEFELPQCSNCPTNVQVLHDLRRQILDYQYKLARIEEDIRQFLMLKS